MEEIIELTKLACQKYKDVCASIQVFQDGSGRIIKSEIGKEIPVYHFKNFNQLRNHLNS